jgi:hypothetical protein
MSTLTTKPVQAQTNESKVRLIAFFVLLLVVIYWLTGLILFPAILVIDFALRSFDRGKFSPLALLSDWIVKTFKLPVKPVYLPPKRFAARIGLSLSALILILYFVNLDTVIVSGILAFFAALESFIGFCAGCYVFDFLQRFRRVN